MIVFSLADKETFEAVKEIRYRIRARRGDRAPIIVVGDVNMESPHIFLRDLSLTNILHQADRRDREYMYLIITCIPNLSILNDLFEILVVNL